MLTLGSMPRSLVSEPRRKSRSTATVSHRGSLLSAAATLTAMKDLPTFGVADTIPKSRHPRSARSSCSFARIMLNDRDRGSRSEEHTSELQSLTNLVCRLLLEKKKNNTSAGGQV